MGVIHKLRPEVLDFIIEQKKTDASLSCRSLTILVLEKLKVKVSKSSINAIFLENGLSLPVGRRSKNKRKKTEILADRIKSVLQGPIINALEIKPEYPLVQVKPTDIVPVQDIALQAEEKKIRDEQELLRLEEEKKIEAEKLCKEAEAAQKARAEEEKYLKEQETKRLAEEDRLKAEAEKNRLKEIELKEQEKKKIMDEQDLLRLIEEQKKIEEERRLTEEALKAEKEKWDKLAEEELKSRQSQVKEAVSKEKLIQKDEDEFASLATFSEERECSGAILLKAVDYLVSGSKLINEIICKRMGSDPKKTLSLTQALIFKSLFNSDLDALWPLLGEKFSQDKLDKFLLQVEQINTIKLDIFRVISNLLIEARGIKMHFMDGNTIYLDGQLHTTWVNPYSPYDFSDTVYNLRNCLNKYFFEGQSLALFTAPGYDMATKEFFNLIVNISSEHKGPDTLTFYGNKLEELESISLNQGPKRSLVFALWPWQYIAYRKVKKIGEFSSYRIDNLGRDLYLAEIEIDLIQGSLKQTVTLKGCALKNSPSEKTRMVILTTDDNIGGLDKIAQAYLGHWPNMEESFQDFSRKIELFTYTGNSQKYFSAEAQGSNIESSSGINEIFENYLKLLDAYLRWHFLPSGYEVKDFSYTNECFYKMQAAIAIKNNKTFVELKVRPGYQFLKDLDYLKYRFNERQIILEDGQLIFV